MNMLEVDRLRVWDAKSGHVIVHDSSFRLAAGECLAIVGESGSGKSMTCRSILRLHDPSIRQSGEIRFQGEGLSDLPERAMREQRGRRISLVMQNGMNAFDPSCKVRVHFRETLGRHMGWTRRQVDERAEIALAQVQLRPAKDVLNKYPHELSGGMLQRLMIALSLLLEPELIIADEPTTALDALSQYEVLVQLRQLKARIGCAMLLISHDLGVVRTMADRILVMRQGRIVEEGDAGNVLSHPRHPYTQHLIHTRRQLTEPFKAMLEEGGYAENERRRKVL
ncbi:staphylopine uptake ABC transporter ATP-binding protein CntD [Paenibacillus hubeiensis]|uniref:staphylopine uptake ABC transporter ATP-binding protein CntD n=1 Tax=Paenibacillus hubeiensis TaxID=3077330 RepID=UPI0031B9D9BB